MPTESSGAVTTSHIDRRKFISAATAVATTLAVSKSMAAEPAPTGVATQPHSGALARGLADSKLNLTPDGICGMTVRELSAAFAAHKLSPVEALKAVVARAEAVNPHVSAFYWRMDDSALAAARASEERWMKGKQLSHLDGVPFSAKDACAVAGTPAPYGSRLNLFAPPSAANEPGVQALLDLGAVVFAKTTMPETGLYQASISGLYGSTRNPWNLSMSTGGSSSGAAAATAAYCGPMHLGDDGGGSLRAPAAFCGAVSLKVSAHTQPFGTPRSRAPFDKGARGPITRDAIDQAFVFSALGVKSADEAAVRQDRLRVVYLSDPIDDPGVGPVHADVARVVESAVEKLQRGRRIERNGEPVYSGPLIEYATIAGFERAAAAYRALPATRLDLLHPIVKQNIQEALASPPGRGALALGSMARDLEAANGRFLRLLERFDVLILPALHHPSFDAEAAWHPATPRVAGRKYAWSSGASPHFGWLSDGPPGIVVPCGLDRSGVPIGLMAIAAAGNDGVLLAFAQMLERELEFKPLFA